jgi:cyclic beta-1,2-glucan synthetase
VTLRANGAGWSRWGETGMTRWRDDACATHWAAFSTCASRSALQPPAGVADPAPGARPQASYRCTFHPTGCASTPRWPDLQTRMTVWVSPEDDIEFRQVELRNLGDEPWRSS